MGPDDTVATAPLQNGITNVHSGLKRQQSTSYCAYPAFHLLTANAMVQFPVGAKDLFPEEPNLIWGPPVSNLMDNGQVFLQG